MKLLISQKKFILPLLGGMLYALGFPGALIPSLFLFPMLGFGILEYFQSQEMKLKTRFAMVFFFALGLTLLGFYWIPYTVHEFGEIPPPFNYLLSIGFCLIVVPQYFIYSFLNFIILRNSTRLSTNIKKTLNAPIIKAFILCLLEHFTPQQFPAHLGHPWLQLAPYTGLAGTIGAIGFSLIAYFCVFSILKMLNERKFNYSFLAILSSFLILNIIQPLKKNKGDTSSLYVRLVQANIGSLMKLDSEKGIYGVVQSVLDTYKEMSSLPSKKPLDLIVWPETAYPNQINSKMIQNYPRFIPKLFDDSSRALNVDLFTGGYDKRKDSHDLYFESEYNGSFFIGKDGKLKDVYHKMKLIPFGEGLPFGPLNEYFSQVITNITYFAQGKRYTLFETSGGIPFSAAICYEILFDDFIRNYLNRTEGHPLFLINITNDSWYGPTSEPYQHLFLSKWRAVENDIPIIRMTNTGISSIIYPDASESKRSGVFTKEVLDIDFEFSKERKPTLFQIYGFKMTVLMTIIIALIQLIITRIKSYFISAPTSETSNQIL